MMENIPLKGERIYLRPVEESDVNERYVHWLNDPETNRYMETKSMRWFKENILEYVQQMAGKADVVFMAICLMKGDAHIGNIKLGPIDPTRKQADLSLFIGEKSLWGKGYGSEAIHTLTRHAFHTLGLSKLRAGCYVTNVASKRAFEKCGYEQEGVLKDYGTDVNGKSVDAILLSLTSSAFHMAES